MIKTPIYRGILQSDLDLNGFSAGGVGGGADARKFDVKTYGATGDGVTDDTVGIQAALADIPAEGGVLYFPAGFYKYSGSTLTLDREITVEGDGGVVNSVSVIFTESPSLTMFTVVLTGCTFKNIAIENVASTPTGAGVVVLGDGTVAGGGFACFDGVTVYGFSIGIDVRAGSAHEVHNCVFWAQTLYSLKLRNILSPDGGDYNISDCWFLGDSGGTPAAAIRYESGGGAKIVNCKINGGNGVGMFLNAIDLAVATGVITSDLLVSNCSIEGFSVCGIKGTTGVGAQWRNSIITGNQFQAFGSSNPSAINLTGGAAGAFDGWTITGNWIENAGSASSNPVIYLANCVNMIVTGNGGNTFGVGAWTMLGMGSGVTFADSPVYIGRDARLVSVSGGAKLQARNPGTDLWADKETWTNP